MTIVNESLIVILLMVYCINGSKNLAEGSFIIVASVHLMISFILSLASQVNTVWNKSKQGRSEELRSERSSKIDTFDTQFSTSKFSV